MTLKPEGENKSPQSVMIRRGKKVYERVPVRWLVPCIQQGKLRPDDEISRDGKVWAELGRHSQLGKYFQQSSLTAEESSAPLPLDFQDKLSGLADMLREINEG
jgi:hypothetical protein